MAIPRNVHRKMKSPVKPASIQIQRLRTRLHLPFGGFAMPRFHLAAEVMIDRPLDQIRAFFADVNHPVLGIGLCKVTPESNDPIAVGARFTTIGPCVAARAKRSRLSRRCS